MRKYNKIIIFIFALLTALISICFVPINASKLIPVIEKQAADEFGIKIHIEKLILRVGPSLKIKAPVMHLMYNDGRKFGQFNNVKFYVSWLSLLKDNVNPKKIYANKLIIRISSDDKYLDEVIKNLKNKNISENPNLRFKDYSISYLNKKQNDRYLLEGQFLVLEKIPGYKNFKLNTSGDFKINEKKYLNYNLSLIPQFDMPALNKKVDIVSFLTQMKDLDFYSDIIADLKLYNNSNNILQASGFINLDNISVLDKTRKDPKSFVYLTLWGDKASILSNIYTSVNKKVYIEGMVNNSKKPVLDLKVRTDEIKLDDLYQKIKLLADCSKYRGIKSVKGTLNANFTLKGDLNKIKSNGYMKIVDAGVKASGLNIERINADIDFSNNMINIVNAVGYVNNAPILARGSIDKSINIELLMNKVELKYLCPASFGIKDGIASLVANISGKLGNIVHNENLQIENLRFAVKGFDTSIESFKIDTNKSDTAYVNNIICKTPEFESLKIPSLKLNVTRDNISVPETNIFMPNSKLVLMGEITNYSSGNITFMSKVSGFINSKDLTKLKSYPGRYPIKITYNGNKEAQNLNAQILLEKAVVLDEPSIVNLTSKIEKNVLRIEDLSVLSFNGKFADDYKTNLKGQKKIVVTGNLEDFKAPVMKNIRIFIPQVLNINLYDTIAQIKEASAKFKKNILGVNISRIKKPIPKTANNSHKCI